MTHLRERVTEAAQRAKDELRAVTPDGGRALGSLRDLLEEWRRRGDPAASAADRRLLESLETVDLNAPEAIDTLAAALAPEPEPEPNWASVSASVQRPATIVGLGDGCLIPVGEVGVLAGPGGQGKSCLTLQIALAVAAAKDGSLVAPFKGTGDECLRVAGGPVVAVGYEDQPGWLRWRLEHIANHLDGNGVDTGPCVATLGNAERLSVAQIDQPLFAAPAHGRRDALPAPTSTWRRMWERATAIGARLVIIDPVGLALETVGFDPAPVNAFYRALRAEAASIECAVLLVAHVTKQGRMMGAEITADAIAGVAAWVDRSRCALTLVRDSETAVVKVVKANYAQQDTVIRLKNVTPDRVAFEAEGTDGGEAEAEAETGDWRSGIA